MHSIIRFFNGVFTTEIVETRPSDGTIRQATQEDVSNPLMENAVKYRLVPGSSVVTLINPERTKDVQEIPQWVLEFAFQQAGSSDVPNEQKYNLITSDLVAKFPGETKDPNDPIRHHTLICEMQQVGTCPEGYQKIYVDNFRPRTRDEIESMLGDKKKKIGGVPANSIKKTEKEIKNEQENETDEQ